MRAVTGFLRRRDAPQSDGESVGGVPGQLPEIVHFGGDCVPLGLHAGGSLQEDDMSVEAESRSNHGVVVGGVGEASLTRSRGHVEQAGTLSGDVGREVTVGSQGSD